MPVWGGGAAGPYAWCVRADFVRCPAHLPVYAAHLPVYPAHLPVYAAHLHYDLHMHEQQLLLCRLSRPLQLCRESCVGRQRNAEAEGTEEPYFHGAPVCIYWRVARACQMAGQHTAGCNCCTVTCWRHSW